MKVCQVFKITRGQAVLSGNMDLLHFIDNHGNGVEVVLLGDIGENCKGNSELRKLVMNEAHSGLSFKMIGEAEGDVMNVGESKQYTLDIEAAEKSAKRAAKAPNKGK